MMNQFYAKRYPLIILISGTVFIGKSTIATKLSERMNISNMLQTKTISDVMGFLDNNYDNHTFKPFYMDDTITSDEDLIKIYENESRIIRKGANFDIQKGFLEGKALIIEGHHIIPSLFIDKDSNGNLYICTPEPENRNETDREKCMRQEMSTIDQRGIIVPFLLTASEKDQRYLLNNNGLFFQGENISFNVRKFNFLIPFSFII
jgi:2-phosphoglycerate kinase